METKRLFEYYPDDAPDEPARQMRLLCMNCNSGLGQFKDNPDLLMSALAYLMSNEETESD